MFPRRLSSVWKRLRLFLSFIRGARGQNVQFFTIRADNRPRPQLIVTADALVELCDELMSDLAWTDARTHALDLCGWVGYKRAGGGRILRAWLHFVLEFFVLFSTMGLSNKVNVFLVKGRRHTVPVSEQGLKQLSTKHFDFDMFGQSKQ